MRRVVITGLGCITPLGNDVITMWNRLVHGDCAIDRIEGTNTEGLPIHVAAQVREFDPAQHGIDTATIRHNDRYALFALAAARQAVKDSGLTVGVDIAPEKIGCAIGSGIGGIQTFLREHTRMQQEGLRRVSPHFIPMMIANIASANVATLYHAEGPNLPVVTACATGTHAVGEAYRIVREGLAEAMICGGTEAAITDISIAGFANSKALSTSEDPAAASLPFDQRRKGFVMGEGAGILVLEEYEHARRRGATIYAEVCGYGNTCDAFHYTAPRPDGKCAAAAINKALQEAYFRDCEQLYINAHGTGTPLNDKTETLAVKMVLGNVAQRAAISSTKSMLGHMLGAAGAVETIISTLALVDRTVPPTIHLDCPDAECDLDYIPHTARDFQADVAISNSFGFGGQNACIALRRV